MNNKLCLNMIVKNEEKVIIRCLDSVIDLIDCFCIYDTGSTDNTVRLIMEYFKTKNIKGKLCFKDFISFDVNRNYCLQQSKDMAEYSLFMDADMVLKYNFSIRDLKLDYYYIYQDSLNIIHKNIRIVKNNQQFKYYGVTHEILQTNNTLSKGEIIPLSEMKIIDLQDGGCKDNKLERDKHLILKNINCKKLKERYLFYLGNTYYFLGENLLALKYYHERLKYKGWQQEIWYCYYRIGLIHYLSKDYSKFVKSMENAFSVDEERIENLYYLIEYYEKKNNKDISNIYKKIALNNLNTNDKLFLEKNLYVKELYS